MTSVTTDSVGSAETAPSTVVGSQPATASDPFPLLSAVCQVVQEELRAALATISSPGGGPSASSSASSSLSGEYAVTLALPVGRGSKRLGSLRSARGGWLNNYHMVNLLVQMSLIH